MTPKKRKPAGFPGVPLTPADLRAAHGIQGRTMHQVTTPTFGTIYRGRSEPVACLLARCFAGSLPMQWPTKE